LCGPTPNAHEAGRLTLVVRGVYHTGGYGQVPTRGRTMPTGRWWAGRQL